MRGKGITKYLRITSCGISDSVLLKHNDKSRLENLEALVLQDLLDGNKVTALAQLSLVDNAERSVANNFCICV